MKSTSLNPFRFFDPNPEIRQIANELYLSVRALPILSPHGHVDARLLADNEPFPDPTELIIIPDHYVYRLLYSQGVSLESLGIPTKDGTPVETDHRKIWQKFADYFYLFAGTPTGVWLTHEFVEVFGVEQKLNSATAMEIYDTLQEKLQTPAFRPRAIFDRFDIELLTTTDGAADSLAAHAQIRNSSWNGRVVPSFRPDAVTRIAHPNWQKEMRRLCEAVQLDVSSFRSFMQALEQRREFFRSMGAASTDQGVFSSYTNELAPEEAERIFARALAGNATAEDAARFEAHMLMEMARMSVEDGMVMQIHAGSWRDHNRLVFDRFGPDAGCDIPMQMEFTRNLHALLNKFGNDRRLTLVVYTLDETTYSRELAPLAGHYPAMKLGAPWWFHDSIQGMIRFRETVTETASIYNTAGFTDDTRAFPSIPARHDLSRRVDCNWLAGLVARHIVGMEEAMTMARALAYDLAKSAYRLGN